MNTVRQSVLIKTTVRFNIANKINRFIYPACGRVMLFYIFLTICGCSVRENNFNGWNPDTYKLDQAGMESANKADLRRDVEHFYECLHKKDWQDTYRLRSQSFRNDYPEALYLDTAQTTGASWGLVNYSILSIEIRDFNEAIIKCKFTESPSLSDIYTTVHWRKEKDGVWRCDSAGPVGLSVFNYNRMGKKTDGD